MRRGRSSVGLVVAIVALVGAVAVTFSCVTVPPPDLASQPALHPTIEHDLLIPPDESILATWPKNLVVPVQINDPTAAFEVEVIVDADPDDPNYSPPPYAVVRPVQVQPIPGAEVGTIQILNVIPPQSDPSVSNGQCHKIEVFVALSFTDTFAPDQNGADTATYSYGINGCPPTWPQDGSFPQDSSSDGAQSGPNSGSGDP